MTDATSDRRQAPRGRDRRRADWLAFRHAYPTFLRVAGVLFLLLVAFDMWLAYRRHAYTTEIEHLRAGMTAAERKKTDLVVNSAQDKLRLELALASHQAHLDTHLHLSIATDSGLMYLEREGAILRVMHVAIAPSRVPGAKPGDTTAVTKPQGTRTVQQVVSGPPPSLVLDGDTRIYAGAETDPVRAGGVRVSAADLQAILPDVSAGMPVYFY